MNRPPDAAAPRDDTHLTDVNLAKESAASSELLPSPDHAWKALGVITDWIKHAETKAGATLAGAGLIGTVLYNLLKDPVHTWWSDAATIICAGLALLGGIFAALALRPRLWTRGKPTSSLYFDHIARQHRRKFGDMAYAESLTSLTSNTDRLVAEIAAQVWANAHVARQKYRWGSLGITCILGSMIFLSIAVIGAVVNSA